MRRTVWVRKTAPLVALVMITLVALGGVAAASHDFSDVPDASPFHEDISWMAESGITEGFPDGTFKPGQPVTRQAMAAFMRRLAGDDPDVDPMVDAALLNGRGSADYDNAVSLNGRTPADFDDAVTLAGRTPADYDNAVSLNGRTPADYDDAVTLAGRTPADYDNAVSLNGRTPADFDDAVTLDGEDALGLLPEVGSDFGTSVTVTGVTSGAATPIVSAQLADAGTKVVMFTALVDTNHDSLLLSCQDAGGVAVAAIPGLSGIKVGDNAVGYSDRFTISAIFTTFSPQSVDIECYAEDKVGSGTVVLVSPRLVTAQLGLPAS